MATMIAAAVVGFTAVAQAQNPVPAPAAVPAPVPASVPAPAPEAPADSLEQRLQKQDELIRQLAEQNKQLVEQNKELGRQVGAISRRLDTISVVKPLPVVAPPKPAGIDAAISGASLANPLTPAAAIPLEFSKPDPPDSEDPDGMEGPGSPTSTGSATNDSPDSEDPDGLEGPGSPTSQPTSGGTDKKALVDSLHTDDEYGFKSLFDSLHPADSKGKHWYEKLSLRGYTQVRYGKTLYDKGARPSLLGDGSINGVAEDFSIRRARLILSGDISDHMALYFQTDFANNLPDNSVNTFYGQLRDAYADVYIDTTKINRFRIGQSKIPYGFDNMQSSGNRVPIDRTESMDSAVFPNQRDLGVFYYWTPVKKQELLRELVEGGLKGSGNYGILALGIYNGQGGNLLEKNMSPHGVARVTWPFRLLSGQVMELSLQGYGGDYVVNGAPIHPMGRGPLSIPAGTNGHTGLADQRIAGTFVYYPQPFGFQSEWSVGKGPGLNSSQTTVEDRSISGGYAMAMYKIDTPRHGIFIPYVRYQYYRGGYRALPNSPFGVHSEWSLGVEWQIRKEFELVTEYGFVDGVNFDPLPVAGAASYRGFNAGILRAQFQFNY